MTASGRKGAGAPDAAPVAELAKWRQRAIDGTDSRKRNTVKALARAERKLRNSMAHIVRPRPADIERWRAMEAHIAVLKAALASMGQDPDTAVRRPLKLKAVAPVGGQPKTQRKPGHASPR